MNRQTTPCRRRRKQPRRYFKDGLWHDERKPDSEVAMMLRVARKPVEIFFAAFILATFAHAQCPVNSIVIKGHVEHLPRNASVGVQLLFAPDPQRASAEATFPTLPSAENPPRQFSTAQPSASPWSSSPTIAVR